MAEAEHRSADGFLISVGEKFWDNDLRVCTVIAVGEHNNSNSYANTGETQTWHKTTRGSSDTLTGHMQPYGRLARFFGGKNAADYPDGTSYNEIKRS